MSRDSVERRLAAILAADVVGYSRLMEANEEGTLGELRRHRREFFDPAVSSHGGRIFKTLGDGFLIEFGSVINAARCAVHIQSGMDDRNGGIPPDRQIKFRIGIHLDDVIVEGEDFYGEGVNMAARLEGLARPGGIACSAVVRHHVGNKLDLEFTDEGPKVVKNITQPVHVYFVDLTGGGASDAQVPLTRRMSSSVVHKPTIAIFPFANLSNDPEQKFFSDGITEDIITDLSKISGLFVLGRNTMFTQRSTGLDLGAVSRQLGATHIVEGSVRKAGNRVRISAQLTEGVSGACLWADRFDRDLSDIFAVQDEIARAVVDQLKIKLLPQEEAAIAQPPTGSAQAYTLYLRGRQIFHLGTRQALMESQRLFERAIELDPGFARARAGWADCASRLSSKHGVLTPVETVLASIDQALAIDPNLAEAHAARGYALMVAERRDEASEAFSAALALDPLSHEAHYHFADFSVTKGDYEAAAKHYIRALELKPDDYISPALLLNVLRSLGRRDEAAGYARLVVRRGEEALRLRPDDSKATQLIATALVELNEPERAKVWIARALEMNPDDSGARYNAACVYALIGESDRALELLEAYVGQVGPDLKRRFQFDSDLDSLRGYPRYVKLTQI